MYSRNTSRRNSFTRVNSQNMQKMEKNVEVREDNKERIDTNNSDSFDYNGVSPERDNRFDNVRNNMPIAPPNYRGMIYDMGSLGEIAEGIDRLVRNDQSYTDNQNKIKDRFNVNRRDGGQRQAFSHMQGIRDTGEKVSENCSQDEHRGLKRLVEGMQNNTISPEDILICALILLMLSSGSEDDIIMILVLMALL